MQVYLCDRDEIAPELIRLCYRVKGFGSGWSAACEAAKERARQLEPGAEVTHVGGSHSFDRQYGYVVLEVLHNPIRNKAERMADTLSRMALLSDGKTCYKCGGVAPLSFRCCPVCYIEEALRECSKT